MPIAMQTNGGKATSWISGLNQFATYSSAFALVLALLLLMRPHPISAQTTELTREQIAVIFLLLSTPSDSTEERTTESVSDYYTANVKTQVIESICLGCHVTGGLASSTNLIFALGDDEANLAVLRDYLQSGNDDGETLLTKVTGGLSHGGGPQLTVESTDYAALSTLITLLLDESGDPEDTTNNEFFKNLILATPAETLRRAALILAGRLPTESEIELAESGDEGLRESIIALMEGPGFHAFLIRGANDRLHTDAFVNGSFSEVSDLNGLAGDR